MAEEIRAVTEPPGFNKPVSAEDLAKLAAIEFGEPPVPYVPPPEKVIQLKNVRTIPTPDVAEQNGHAEPPPNTWQPANLLELAANPPAPPTIGGILYPGKRTVLSGETESMKTWLALILCKAELDINLTVAWVDLDAMGPGALLERLQLLGVDDQAIGERFLYYQPSEMLDPAKLTAVTATITERGVRLFVIDAFNPILGLHGLNPNDTPDIETFWRTIADPICQAGAAPTLLDHVVKNADNRGKYAYGSERKASGVDGVHLGFRLLEPLTKGGRGRSLLTVHKDRPGYLPRPTLGRLVITSEGDTITYKIEPDISHDQGGFRPTVLMEKISRTLETEPEPVNQKWVTDNITGNTEAKITALKKLSEDGYLAQQPGPRNATLYRSVRAYREADDHPDSTSSSPLPDLSQNLRSLPTVTFPSPYGERSAADPGKSHQTTFPIHEYEHPPIDPSLQPYDGDE